MNLALAIYIWLMCATIGFKAWALIQIPTLMVGASFIMWMFYLNHNYEGVNWDRSHEWGFEKAAMEGSSCLVVSPVLRWLSGNSGYHHIHHLFPEIPNYNMERCLRGVPEFQTVDTIGLRDAWRALFLRLWDEDQRQLIRFDQLPSRPSDAEDVRVTPDHAL
jgi:omega-6 fatty acid desaturase (delta-12 desaturase)